MLLFSGVSPLLGWNSFCEATESAEVEFFLGCADESRD